MLDLIARLLQHVMAWGIERRMLFRDDKDRNSFLGWLVNILKETQLSRVHTRFLTKVSVLSETSGILHFSVYTFS